MSAGKAEKENDIKPHSTHKHYVASLKKNFLPILVSPRVDSIPSPYKLTIFAFAFVAIASAAASFVYTIINKETSCVAAPVPLNPSRPPGSCQSVLLRKEFVREETIQFLNQDLRENIESSILMNLFVPELFDDDAFSIEGNIVGSMIEEIQEVASDVDLNGVLNLPEILDDLVDIFSPHPFVLSAKRENASLNVGANFFDDELDSEEEVEAESLVLNYLLKSKSKCTLILQPSFSEIEGLLVSTCGNANADENVVFDVIYTAEQPKNIFFHLISFLRNMHLDDSSIENGNDEEDNFEGESIVEELLTTSNAFCCEDVSLSFFEVYGMMMGFGFAFEGFVTFLFATTLFKGRLGLERSNPRSQGSYTTATKDLRVVPVEGIDEDNDEDEDLNDDNGILFDSELKKKMYQKKGVKTLGLVDLQRAVFNPRCRMIPHATIISLIAVWSIVIIAAVSAYVLQKANVQEICDSTELALADNSCEEATIRSLVFIESPREPNGFGSFSLDHTLVLANYNFNLLDVTFGEDLQEDLISACSDENVLPSGEFCIDSIAGLQSTSGTTNKTNGNFNEFELTVSTFTSTDIAAFFKIEERISDTEVRLKLDYQVANRDFRYQVRAEVSSKNVLNADFNSTRQGSTMIKEFLSAVAINPETLETALGATLVSCCKDVSLAYYEYLGLVLGYVTLGEGLLTLLVAYSIYNLRLLISKLNRKWV